VTVPEPVAKCGLIVSLLSLSLFPAHDLDAQTPASTCSPTNYTKITNTEPLPSDFCAYTVFPFRTRLPEDPKHIDQKNTDRLRSRYLPSSYPQNGSPFVAIGRMPDAAGAGACDASITYCHGSSGYPVWIASADDPVVTVDCASARYGCSKNMTGTPSKVRSIPSFRIPANYRPSSNVSDRNGQIIQPNGDAVLIYGCWPSRDFQTGDVLKHKGGICSNLAGAHYTNVVTGSGLSLSVNGGSDFAALPARYHEVMNGQINHALLAWAGCVNGSVYPGHGARECSDGDGIPAGAHLFLGLTHAQIDALIAQGLQPANTRPFLYALHDYGMYIFDTGGRNAKRITQPLLEEPTAIVINGAPNPWETWFKANGGRLAADGSWKTMRAIDYRPLAPWMYVVSACYARGTCSDSVAPSSASGAPTGGPQR
jgi:hypothetical protein